MKDKLSYIVSLFPCWSETFILNEMIELTQRGVDITIFSIRTDRERFTQEKAIPFLDKTIYPLKRKVLMAAFVWFGRKPKILFPLFFKACFSRYKHPGRIRLKNIWSIFLGCYFARIHIEEKIEHIHAHFATYPSLVAMVVSRLTGIPFTFTAHAHDIFLDKVLLKEKLDAAQKVITISEYNRDYLIKNFGETLRQKINVIHCGLDLEEWKSDPARTHRARPGILCVGRLTPMKGFGALIHACALLKKDMDFECHIIGEGERRKAFTRLIKEQDLWRHVFLEGVKDSVFVREQLKRSTVFVVPSVWDDRDGQDGIPLVMMEALAMGVPVIASRISGIPELIEDEETGLLIEPGDVPSLTEQLKRLLSDDAMQKKFAQSGRAKIEKEFNVKVNAEKLLKVIYEN